MARPLRLLVANGVYHVTARGNQKADIYRDDADRETFLGLLGRVVDRFGWRCLSYCLMGNHFHLLVRTPEPNLSRGVQQLKSGYAQEFNERHDRVGHLFGGRFKAPLIQQDAHLLEVFRYIALNPVEAGYCRDPLDWPWSAHPALAGKAAARSFLAVQEARGWFATDGGLNSYERFVSRDEPCAYDPSGPVFGDADFKRSVLPCTSPGTEISERDWGEGRPPLSDILSATPGGDGIARAYRTHGYTLRAIADALGCHPCTVSRKLKAFERECSNARSDPL